ncbi:hypothetical protein JDV02_005655 [Purpureocillium takamizusanense]|uniref:Uncharacterized protein n=1 Tax=Purpureocillium takamizusanense TaxID=2060973 RepID=A0A9Q8VBA3_9HYPO|nr:uncharacterized protein JDV02_005655 [Purpureocillium takamizusanense]UNI19473.1 hypothetical protein JDV02_005655 [Purpureocillium takamizusanense]
MTPYREPPPIAHHLNRPRPQATPSPVPRDSDKVGVSIPTDAVDSPRCRSSPTVLHSQIRHLQRQLSARVDESTQLRRQLEAQQNAEVGTLSEQLRVATRDVSMWKERAESAEKRVKVFEKFTVKLRDIRDTLFAERRTEGARGARGQPGPVTDDAADKLKTSVDGRDPDATVMAERSGSRGARASEDSGDAADVGVVSARIRKCLHGPSPGAVHDGTVDDSTPAQSVVTRDGTWSPQGRCEAGVEGAAAQMLLLAEELLDMVDGGRVQGDGIGY